HIGGHAYGWVYGGPIGAVITPLLRDVSHWGELAEASSLCGACAEVCPVKIPLHDLLIGLRRETGRRGKAPRRFRQAFGVWRRLMSDARRWERGLRVLQLVQRPFVRNGRLRWAPPPVDGWLAHRELPALASQSFRQWWRA